MDFRIRLSVNTHIQWDLYTYINKLEWNVIFYLFLPRAHSVLYAIQNEEHFVKCFGWNKQHAPTRWNNTLMIWKRELNTEILVYPTLSAPPSCRLPKAHGRDDREHCYRRFCCCCCFFRHTNKTIPFPHRFANRNNFFALFPEWIKKLNAQQILRVSQSFFVRKDTVCIIQSICTGPFNWLG